MNNIITMSDFYEKLQSFSYSWFNNDIDATGHNVRSIEPCKDKKIEINIKTMRSPASWLSQKYYLAKATYEIKLRDVDHCNVEYTYIINIEASDFLGNKMDLREIAFRNINRFLMKNGYGCLKKEVAEKMVQTKYEDAK